MKCLQFSADVNGQRREVVVPLEILPDVLCDDDGDASHTLDEVELQVMNDQGLYFAFYDGAGDEEFDAELTERQLEWVDL